MQNGKTTATGNKQLVFNNNKTTTGEGLRTVGIGLLWDEVSLMNGCKGGVGVRVDELIDCHTRVASTFRQRGAIQFIKKTQKLNNNDLLSGHWHLISEYPLKNK